MPENRNIEADFETKNKARFRSIYHLLWFHWRAKSNLLYEVENKSNVKPPNNTLQPIKNEFP